MRHPILDIRFQHLSAAQKNVIRGIYRAERFRSYGGERQERFSIYDSRYVVNARIDEMFDYYQDHDIFNCWFAHNVPHPVYG